jgi:hypothetical protein
LYWQVSAIQVDIHLVHFFILRFWAFAPGASRYRWHATTWAQHQSQLAPFVTITLLLLLLLLSLLLLLLSGDTAIGCMGGPVLGSCAAVHCSLSNELQTAAAAAIAAAVSQVTPL